MAAKPRKTVLITGATSGIGLSVARHLSERGYDVYGTYRREIPEGEHNFKYVKLDVRDEKSIGEAVQQIMEKSGKIDVLINNAGLGTLGAIEDTTIEEAADVFKTNVLGVHAMCRAVLPVMRAQKSGTILNITSIAGKVALPFRGIYNATKFAVEGMSEAMSMEVRPFGIHVVILRPGDYKTNIDNNRKVARKAKSPDSAYFNSFNRAFFQIKEEINTAWTPHKIAVDIDKILRKKNPSLHYTSAPFIQKLSIPLHWIMPSRIFEWLVIKFYKV